MIKNGLKHGKRFPRRPVNEAKLISKYTYVYDGEAGYLWEDGDQHFSLQIDSDIYFGEIYNMDDEDMLAEATEDITVKKQGKMIGECIGKYLSKYGKVMEGDYWLGTGPGPY